jgi:D-glycero-D-manno-heptose 1,7-bisphosphate phosphatase
MNRALFLDRDGVINEDYGYVHKIEDFHFREGVFDVCRAAQKERMKIVVVTNQAGIGRGLYAKSDFDILTAYMLAEFRSRSIVIAAVLHCPFHPSEGKGHYRKQSYFRKPMPGMFIEACTAYSINPFHSVMIGDRLSDKIACNAAGIRWYIDALQKDWAKSATKLILSLS